MLNITVVKEKYLFFSLHTHLHFYILQLCGWLFHNLITVITSFQLLLGTVLDKQMLSLQNKIRHTLLPVATCEICKEPLFSAFSFSEIICWLSLLILTYKSDASIVFLGASKEKNKTLPYPWLSSSTASSALCPLATSGFPLSLCRQTQEGLCLQVPRDVLLVETAREVAGHHRFISTWIGSVQKSP